MLSPHISSLCTDFIRAATWNGSLDAAETLLAGHPELADPDIHTAAVLADTEKVRKFLTMDPGQATAHDHPAGCRRPSGESPIPYRK